MRGDHFIVFTPSGKRGRFSESTSVLEAAQRLGVDLDSVCGGRGICGRCQILVSEGSFAKHGIDSASDHLSTVNDVERSYAERKKLLPGRRLGCQSRLSGDVVIDVPAESQRHPQIVRKRAEARAITVDAVVEPYYVTVEEPDLDNPASDVSRILAALEAQWQLSGLTLDVAVLPTLQQTLRAGDWAVTVAVYDGAEIVGLWPGYHECFLGLAVDIGSTTIAAHLCDLRSGEVLASSGMMNPQIRFGEDLMSRVSYVMMNPDGIADMITAVREAVNTLARNVTQEAGVTVGDVLDSVFVGNPIMHHLFLGLDPTELGGAPFALATGEAMTLKARDLDLAFHPAAHVHMLPCIAGHVGADCAAVILSESPHVGDEMSLVVDVGTNAEIVLGNRDRLLAASSPTGPAFEGAQISSGQRAAPGAIERVRIEPETLEPRYRIIGVEQWSNAEGFEKAIGKTGVTGICGSGIIEAIAEMFLAGIVDADGVIRGETAAKSSRVVADGRTFSYILRSGKPEIRVTQADIRAIQLAKAALYAGARLLMDRMGVDQVDRISLAGAFGSHIDGRLAMVLGMIPDCPLAKVTSPGNAAGTGARIALLNRRQRAEIAELVRTIEKVETALEPRFQEHFVAAMALPHKSATYSNLSQVVTLPEAKAAAARAHGRRKRRRARR